MTESEDTTDSTDDTYNPDVDKLLAAMADQKVLPFLISSHSAGHLIDWVHQETGISKARLTLVLRVITPVCARLAGKLGRRTAHGFAEKALKILAKNGWFKETAKALHSRLQQAINSIDERKTLEQIASGHGTFLEPEFGQTLSIELRIALRNLAQNESLQHDFDRIYLAIRPQPQLRLVFFPKSEATRFLYTARRVPLFGRKNEVNRLSKFLYSDSKFAWWSIVGPGGKGKSRVALEVALANLSLWYSGFVPQGLNFDWENWQPSQPTFVIADYVSQRPSEVSDIAHILASRTDLENPVRLLLLEREHAGNWQKEFMSYGTRKAIIESARFDDTLLLEDFSDETVWSLIEAVFSVEGKSAPTDKKAIVHAITEIDPSRRPLFVSFAADALAAGRDIRGWDQDVLLRDVLERDQQAFWEPAGVTQKELNLVALSTMTQEFLVSRLDAIRDTPILPESSDYVPDKIAAITGLDSRETVPALLPDILGSFYVLTQLEPQHGADNRLNKLRDLAWKLEPQGLVTFLIRTFTDFPEHPLLEKLRRPLRPSNKEQRAALARFLAFRSFTFGKTGNELESELCLQTLENLFEECHEKAVSEALTAAVLGQLVIALESRNKQTGLRQLDRLYNVWDKDRSDENAAKAVALGWTIMVPVFSLFGIVMPYKKFSAVIKEVTKEHRSYEIWELRFVGSCCYAVPAASGDSEWTEVESEIQVLRENLREVSRNKNSARAAAQMLGVFVGAATQAGEMSKANKMLGILKDDLVDAADDPGVKAWAFIAILHFVLANQSSLPLGRKNSLLRRAKRLFAEDEVDDFIDRWLQDSELAAKLKQIARVIL